MKFVEAGYIKMPYYFKCFSICQKKVKFLQAVFISLCCTIYLRQLKKWFTILFSVIFLLQALPVKQWLCASEKPAVPVEMTDNTDSAEKKNAEKEIKEEIVFQNQPLNWNYSGNINKLKMLASQHAVILHHSEVSGPPPDFI